MTAPDNTLASEVVQADADRVSRTIGHYLDRLEHRNNGGWRGNKTSGYEVAEVPSWQLRRWKEALDATRQADERVKELREGMEAADRVIAHAAEILWACSPRAIAARPASIDADLRHFRAILAKDAPK